MYRSCQGLRTQPKSQRLWVQDSSTSRGATGRDVGNSQLGVWHKAMLSSCFFPPSLSSTLGALGQKWVGGGAQGLSLVLGQPFLLPLWSHHGPIFARSAEPAHLPSAPYWLETECPSLWLAPWEGSGWWEDSPCASTADKLGELPARERDKWAGRGVSITSTVLCAASWRR